MCLKEKIEKRRDGNHKRSSFLNQQFLNEIGQESRKAFNFQSSGQEAIDLDAFLN